MGVRVDRKVRRNMRVRVCTRRFRIDRRVRVDRGGEMGSGER